jgi:hypothetical protein
VTPIQLRRLLVCVSTRVETAQIPGSARINPSRTMRPSQHHQAPCLASPMRPLARCDRTTKVAVTCIGFASSSAHTHLPARVCPLVKVPGPARSPGQTPRPRTFVPGRSIASPHSGPKRPPRRVPSRSDLRTSGPCNLRLSRAACATLSPSDLSAAKEIVACVSARCKVAPEGALSLPTRPPVSGRLPGMFPRAAGNTSGCTYGCQGRIAD